MASEAVQKNRLQKDLATIFVLMLIVGAALAGLAYVDMQNDVIAQWSADFYTSLVG